MNNSIIQHFSRDQQYDNPVIVVYSLVGNDVCNGLVSNKNIKSKIEILFNNFKSNDDTLAHMTKPDVFYKSVVESMQYLDTKLPNGSHVLLTSLANGSYLYGLLSNRVHPLGRLRGDVLYKNMYDYLTCLNVNFI
jgi:acyloxyacyl hydrolase